jgi:membrane protease YdiL (CAAX protease family)
VPAQGQRIKKSQKNQCHKALTSLTLPNYYKINTEQKEIAVSSPDKASTNPEEPVSVNTLEDEDAQSTDDFKGIWDKRAKRNDIVENSKRFAKIQPEMGGVAAKKGWGLGSFALVFLAFIAIQVVISIAILVPAVMNSGPNLDAEKLVSSAGLIVVTSLAMYASWVGGMAIVSRVRGKKSFKEDFWLQFKKFDVLIGLGIAVGLVLLVALSGWFFGDVLKLDLSAADNGKVFTNFTGFQLVIVAFGIASLLGPIMEELFFRGFLFQAVRNSINIHLKRVSEESEGGATLAFAKWMQKKQYWFAIIISSIVFGFMHMQTTGVGTFGWWYLLVATGTLGLVFGIIAAKTKRIGIGIFGHVFYNSITLLMAVIPTLMK